MPKDNAISCMWYIYIYVIHTYRHTHTYILYVLAYGTVFARLIQPVSISSLNQSAFSVQTSQHVGDVTDMTCEVTEAYVPPFSVSNQEVTHRYSSPQTV